MNRRNLLVTGLCTAAIVSLSSAGASAEDKIAPKTLEFLEATTISGYVEASYTYLLKQNIIGQNQHRHSDATVGAGEKHVGAKGSNQLRAFDNNQGFTANGLKLVLEKPLGEGDWAAGYRADLLFGQDAQQLGRAEGTSSPFFDPETTGEDEESPDAYGLYIEQAYVAFRLPVGNGADFKFGRFVALSGYEVIESPANLNFSRGLLFTWADPLAHSGLLGSYRFNDSFDAQLGVVNGWNDWIDDNAEPALIWRLGWRNPSGTASLGVSGFYGRARYHDPAYEEGTGGGINPNGTAERWFFDGVANFKPTEKVLLGVEALIGNQADHNGTVGGKGTGNDQWWGVAGYCKLQLNDKVHVAGRAEYLNDKYGWLFSDDHASFDPIHDTDDAGKDGRRIDVWSLTGTIGFDVWRNMLLRLEARYDAASTSGLGDSSNPPFDPNNNQLTFAADVIYSF